MAQTTKLEYSHPEVLVDTQWIEEHLNDPNIRIVEVDYDSQANYHLGHIPGAILLEWKNDINHPVSRDILSADSYKHILRKLGLDDDKSITIVLYGDFNNWFAAFAFWVFKYYGYENLKLINGGRRKWLDEDRPISKETDNLSKRKFNFVESFKPNSKIVGLSFRHQRFSCEQKEISDQINRCKKSTGIHRANNFTSRVSY